MKIYRAIAYADALQELLEIAAGDLEVDVTTLMDVAGWGASEKALFLSLQLEILEHKQKTELRREVCDA